jgi:hypothetical protein
MVGLLSLALVVTACGTQPAPAAQQKQAGALHELLAAVEEHDALVSSGIRPQAALEETDVALDLVPSGLSLESDRELIVPALELDPRTGKVLLNDESRTGLLRYAAELEELMSAQARPTISRCYRQVNNAHVSKTQDVYGNIIVKGAIQCESSRDTFRVTAFLQLYRAGVGDVFNTLYATGPQASMLTSSRGRTELKQHQLWAHSTCRIGRYFGAMNTKYQNLQGITIAIGAPLSGRVSELRCS